MPDSSLRIGVIQAHRSSGIDAPENGATTTLEVDQVSATEALSAIDVIAEAFLNDRLWHRFGYVYRRRLGSRKPLLMT
jgi:hypothetical protein